MPAKLDLNYWEEIYTLSLFHSFEYSDFFCIYVNTFFTSAISDPTRDAEVYVVSTTACHVYYIWYCVDHNKLWKILKEMGIPDHLTCLLGNLYADQEEATVRTGHGTIDWFQIKKGVRQGCILSPCLFNLYVEYIMRNAGLEEAQAGNKIAGRNINNSDMQMTPPLWKKV